MKKTVTMLSLSLLGLIFLINPAFSGERSTKEECIKMCEHAAALFLKIGREATIEKINDKEGPFVWKDSYVFALESDTAVLVAHPIKPNIVGKNLIGMKDVNGKLIFVEFANVANSKAGKGWVHYWWPKPGEKKFSPKLTYIYKVPGMKLAVGAGIYE